jgi:hypothetical protein
MGLPFGEIRLSSSPGIVACRMAREMTRGVAALLFVLAAAACGPNARPAALVTPAPTPVPTPAPGGGWAQALTFSGDVRGSMDHVVAAAGTTTSECTGRNSRTAGEWASALLGPVGPDVYEVLVTVRPYRGPGTYRAPEVTVQLSRPDGSAAWQTLGTDPATFVVSAGEESGSLDARLTNLSSTTTAVRVHGHWSCLT